MTTNPALPAEVQPPRADATAGPITRQEWTASQERCLKCLSPFNPADTRHNGNARHADTPYCRYCVDLCRLSQAVLHLCEICR